MCSATVLVRIECMLSLSLPRSLSFFLSCVIFVLLFLLHCSAPHYYPLHIFKIEISCLNGFHKCANTQKSKMHKTYGQMYFFSHANSLNKWTYAPFDERTHEEKDREKWKRINDKRIEFGECAIRCVLFM